MLLVFRFFQIFFVLYSSISIQSLAFAYVGPGAGLSLMSSVIALLSTIFFALFMIASVPIKRYKNKKRQEKEALEDDNAKKRPAKDVA